MLPLRDCVNFIAHNVSASQKKRHRVCCRPPTKSLCLVIDILSLSLSLSFSLSREFHYFRLHVYLHNRCRFLRVWYEWRTKHMPPETRKHTIENHLPNFANALALPLSHDAYFCEKCIDLFHDTKL